MTEPVSALNPSVRAALQKLADIAVPNPVSMVPQTWGWAALTVIVLSLCLWGLRRWHHHRKANRYRTEALAELTRIERSVIDCAEPGPALTAIPPLLKRVALAACPRSQVAGLSQKYWADFLAGMEGERRLPAPLVDLLNDGEYRPTKRLNAIPAEDVRACVQAARHWIETHRVSA